MSILQILPTINVFGGTPKKTLDLIIKSKHTHIVYTRNRNMQQDVYDKGKAEFVKNGIILEEGEYNRNLFRHLFHINRIIKKYGIKIIHVYFDIDCFLVCLLKFFFPNIMIVRSHENCFTFDSQLLRSIKFNSFYKIVYNFVDMNIFISNYVKETKLALFKNIPSERYITIYNGTTFNSMDSNCNYNIANTNKLVTTAALIKLKNIKILISAMAILRNTYELDIQLYILGDGPERDNLSNMIQDYKLTNCVFMVGHTSDVKFYLSQADIYVHPSIKEGFGIAVIEAMMMKKPIILSNAAALPELIDDSCGFLVKPHDAFDWAEKIAYLINNKELKEKMGAASYNRATKLFNIKTAVEKHDSIYDCLLNHP